MFASEIIRYGLTLAAIVAGGSRLNWLFGDDVRLALWHASVGLCNITGQAVCF